MAPSNYGLVQYIGDLQKREDALQKELVEVRAARSHAERTMKEKGIRADLPRGDNDGSEDKAKDVTEDRPKVGPRQYSRMRPGQAALAYLREIGRPATTTEIRHALETGNVKTTASKFHQSLYNTLKRMAEKDGSVVSHGDGIWAFPGQRTST